MGMETLRDIVPPPAPHPTYYLSALDFGFHSPKMCDDIAVRLLYAWPFSNAKDPIQRVGHAELLAYGSGSVLPHPVIDSRLLD